MEKKYQSLNVLNQKSKLPLDEDAVINKINAMVNASGNRSQRRKIAKSLNKTSTIAQYANERAEKKVDAKVEIRAEKDFMYIFGILGIVLGKNYHWSDEQITSFYMRVTGKMEEYAHKGWSTDQIVYELERLTGIELVPERR